MSTTWPTDRRTSVRDLRAAKARGERWSMLTAYDALTAKVFEDAGVRVLLVGDTAGMLVYGHGTTVPVTLDEMLPLAAAVVRGTTSAFVVGDLPFGTYQDGPSQALASAVRYLKEAQVHGVKLEGGEAVVPQVRALVAAGIPVMGHLGLTPQSVNVIGGMQYVQGRGTAGAQLLQDALALQEAGAFAVVLEAVPAALGAEVTAALDIPTVGIGAGASTDAQVLVWQDAVGLTDGRLPKFVKRYADLRAVLHQAVSSYVEEVASGAYPGDEHQYS